MPNIEGFRQNSAVKVDPVCSLGTNISCCRL